jgi:predicted PhzF superfamily epimerase YddE/YHI9
MSRYSVLRVFCAADGSGGNKVAVFLTGAVVPPAERQAAAAAIGFSETVFVDDVPNAEVRIFTPAAELDFAGHPLVGTAWLLERERELVEELRPPAGALAARVEGERAYIAGRPEWGPPHEFLEFGSAAEIDALEGPPEGRDLVTCWAWIDEPGGSVRARAFLPRIGIAEDEATGSAAVMLAALLGRDLEIHQGTGSVIQARPLADGWVEIGGHVVLDDSATL